MASKCFCILHFFVVFLFKNTNSNEVIEPKTKDANALLTSDLPMKHLHLPVGILVQSPRKQAALSQVWRMPSPCCIFHIFPQMFSRIEIKAHTITLMFLSGFFRSFSSTFCVLLKDPWPPAEAISLMTLRLHWVVHRFKDHRAKCSNTASNYILKPPSCFTVCMVLFFFGSFIFFPRCEQKADVTCRKAPVFPRWPRGHSPRNFMASRQAF